MTTSSPTSTTLDVWQLMRDLEAGRSLPLRPPDRLLLLRALPRPTVEGFRFRGVYLAVRILGRLHPRLARRPLLQLWFTPWVHPAASRPVADLAADVTAWSLTVDRTVLRGYTGGTGPTVVLVHGWAGQAADWRHLAADLIAAGHRVVVPDLPAHGATPGRTTDLFALAGALAGVLASEQPVAVVTHSFGFPTAVLAIEQGAPLPETMIALAPGRRLASAVEAFLTRARLPIRLAAELRIGIEAAYGPDVWERLDVDHALPSLATTGLVIHDRGDDEVSLEDARAIVAGWPGADLAVTGGLGHRRIMRDLEVRRTVVETVRDAVDGTTTGTDEKPWS